MLQQKLTFSVFVSELKGLDQTKGLLNGASNREVIDGDLPQDALVVNDEQTSEVERKSGSWTQESLSSASRCLKLQVGAFNDVKRKRT